MFREKAKFPARAYYFLYICEVYIRQRKFPARAYYFLYIYISQRKFPARAYYFLYKYISGRESFPQERTISYIYIYISGRGSSPQERTISYINISGRERPPPSPSGRVYRYRSLSTHRFRLSAIHRDQGLHHRLLPPYYLRRAGVDGDCARDVCPSLVDTERHLILFVSHHPILFVSHIIYFL